MSNQWLAGVVIALLVLMAGVAATAETGAGTPGAGATQPAGFTLEQAIAIANAYVKDNNLDWGQATRAIHMRGAGIEVFFDTPDEEMKKMGPRTLQVAPGGKVIVPKRKG
jgi:hypothetical protein